MRRFRLCTLQTASASASASTSASASAWRIHAQFHWLLSRSPTGHLSRMGLHSSHGLPCHDTLRAGGVQGDPGRLGSWIEQVLLTFCCCCGRTFMFRRDFAAVDTELGLHSWNKTIGHVESRDPRGATSMQGAVHIKSVVVASSCCCMCSCLPSLLLLLVLVATYRTALS